MPLTSSVSRSARFVRVFTLSFLVAGSFLLSGCISSMLAKFAVTAPNLQEKPHVVRDKGYREKFDAVPSQSWRLPVGPPDAELAISVVEPGRYAFTQQITVKQNEKGYRWLEPEMTWTVPLAPENRLPVKGTVLLLHGYRDSKENMMHWAVCLAEFGYRTVLVDLRGHGRSTGNLIGHGAFEAKDMSQLIDELQKRGLAGDHVAMLGVSYGASTSLLTAARDPRVKTVIALEPSSGAKTAVVEFAYGVQPKRAAQLGRAVFDSAVKKAPKLGGFSWDDNDVLAAMPRVKVPVLFFHGSKDTWLAPANSERLMKVAAPGSRLEIIEGDDHVILSMRLANIAPMVSEWLGEKL